MTEREVMADLVRFVGVLTYGKERWFKQNGCWYDRMFGDYIQNEVLLERITKAINGEIEDRPTGEVNAVKLYEGAVNDLENNKITLGEFEKRIEPLKHLYYDRTTSEVSDRLLKESDVLKIAFQLPYIVNSAFFDAVKALPSADATEMMEDGTLAVRVSGAKDVSRVLVMDTDSHVGGGLYYVDKDNKPTGECRTCGRNADNGGVYEDGRTKCPIQEHYALLLDGYCHLYEPYNCGAKMGGDTE